VSAYVVVNAIRSASFEALPEQDLTMPAQRPRETAAIVRLSDALIAALRAVIDSSPFAGLGPIELGRNLGVDKTLASRLMSALRATDSMVALSLLPGVVPLRAFLAAAREHGAGARRVTDAERRLRAFDHELERSFGTRTRLDALLVDSLPEARRRHEDTARQAVYRGMALLKGVSIELESFTWIVHPSRKGAKRVDLLFLGAFVGVHRLRPTARFRVAAGYRRSHPEAGARLLRRFCRPEHLSISSSVEKDYVFYEVSTGSVRRDAAADVFLTEHMPEAASRTDPASEKGAWGVGNVLAYPVKRVELVLLVHRDVWPDGAFEVVAYDTAGRGPVRLPDPDRESDRLSVDSAVEVTTASEDALRSSAVPGYAEILRSLMTPLGWKLEAAGRPAFRCFRCSIAYPIYGSQIMLQHR
jgi:hypothetical protein